MAGGVSHRRPEIPMKMRAVVKSLAFRIAVPLLVICMLGGVGVYFAVQRTFARFTERQLGRVMAETADDVYALCDGSRTGLGTPLPRNPKEVKVRQAITMGMLEDFFRQKGLVGFIDTGTTRVKLNAELSPDLQAVLQRSGADGSVQMISHRGARYAVVHRTFAPWNWRIVLARQRTAYAALVYDLRSLYLHITYLLILGFLGLFVALEEAVRRPLKAIIETVRRGGYPKMTGITELDFLAERLNDALRKRQSLVESLEKTHFIYSHDRNGIFTYLSSSVTEMLGYLPEEFQKHYATYLTDHPANREVARRTELSIQGKQQPPYEVEIFHRDGSRRWLEVAEVPVFDGSGKVVAVEGIARDVTGRRLLQDDREQLIAELQKAAAEIKTLRGIIPICASCKKVRDDEGAWQQVEAYLREHSEAEFSHGICPDCLAKMYPGFTREGEKDT